MRALLPLLIGTALWSYAGWSAHPRELWDVSTFQPVWLAATLAAAAFGVTRGQQAPCAIPAFMFLPIFGALTVNDTPDRRQRQPACRSEYWRLSSFPCPASPLPGW